MVDKWVILLYYIHVKALYIVTYRLGVLQFTSLLVSTIDVELD